MAEKITIPEAVESIREDLRDEISENRKKKRHQNLNKNRKALGEMNENDTLSVEFVKNAALHLKKKSLNPKDYGKLQNALLQSEDHINAFFSTPQIIDALLRDLSGFSSASKLASANCCCNLALGNEKACNTLCKRAAPYLIAELESSCQPLVEVCAWTIGNLVGNSDRAFYVLQAQECFKSLMNLALHGTDDVLPAASYALLRYLNMGYKVKKINIEDIKPLKALFKRFPAVSDVDTMWLIAYLSSKSEFEEDLKNCTPAFCDYLLQALFKEDESIKKITAALRIICNTVSEPTGVIAHYLFKNEFEMNKKFLDKLLCHPYLHIRKETLWLLGNLLNHPSATVQQIVKPNILTSMSSQLKLATNSLGLQ